MSAPQTTSFQLISDKPRFQATEAVVHIFLPNSPLMQVVEPVRQRSGKENKIVGISCCWFLADGQYQTAIFNTAMLRHALPTELPVGYQPRTLATSSLG